jgi:acyl-CoA thioesterase-1
MTVTMFGDSILKGILLEDGHYTVNHAWEERFSDKYGIEIRNQSHMGLTVEKGLSRMENDIRRGHMPGDYAIIGFGGNDCDYSWKEVAEDPEGEHACAVPAERFRELYRQAIQLVRKAGAKPICAVPPPIDAEKYLNHICRSGLSRERILLWLGDVNAIYRWEERYARLAECTAEQEGAMLVDLREPFLAKRRLDRLLCDDGIHPSPEGQKLVYESFCSFADEILRRDAVS